MLATVLEENPLAVSIAFLSICLAFLLARARSHNPNAKLSLAAHVLATLQKRFLGYAYLLDGADMVEKGYIKAQGKPFVIQTPGKQNVMVSSLRHIKEVSNAPSHQLSLHAVAKDFLQPKYTMHGFEWKDQRGIEGTGFVRALRNLLTSHLPNVLFPLSTAIADQFQRELSTHKVIEGYHRIPIFDMAKKLVVRANSVVFFGPELANNQDFNDAALRFPEDVFLAAEILRIMPGPIAPFLASLVTRGHRSSTTMYDYLLPVAARRLEMRHSKAFSNHSEKPSDGIQWLVETSPRKDPWSAERLVGEIMGVWYGSVHTLAIATTNALTDLYSNTRYIEPLRNEAQGPEFAEFKKTAKGLPFLDSFLKESARVNAFESTGLRRQALQPFTFSDGLRIATGDWVCVPSRAMMRDSQNFSNPLEFEGFRWVTNERSTDGSLKGPASSSILADSSDKWLIWGLGRIVCPGRFYAVVVLKIVLAYILCNHDCKLQKISGSRSTTWRSAIIPSASVILWVREREDRQGHLI